MSDSIKMNDNELAEVRMLQEKFQQKIFQLGRIEVAFRDLANQKNKALEEWTNLQKMESELMDKLLKKYGEGSLDLNAGTFIPEQKPTA